MLAFIIQVPPVKVVCTQSCVKAFQGTLYPPELELDLVHLTKSAFCHLNPVSLKIVLLEVPELPEGSIKAIHEYSDPHRDPQHTQCLILRINRVYPSDQLRSVAPQELVSHVGKEKVAEHGYTFR